MCLYLTLITNVAWAISSAEKLPAQLESDSALCQHQKNIDICTYSGNAKFNQGATNVQAEQIAIHKIGKKINKIVALGKHSTYNTITNNNQQKINAVADSITIDYTRDMMILEGNGMLTLDQHRYRGSHIEYKFD